MFRNDLRRVSLSYWHSSEAMLLVICLPLTRLKWRSANDDDDDDDVAILQVIFKQCQIIDEPDV